MNIFSFDLFWMHRVSHVDSLPDSLLCDAEAACVPHTVEFEPCFKTFYGISMALPW